MNTKVKKKRRQEAKSWVKEYQGSNVLHAYKRKFKVSLTTAINDLDAIGVKLDKVEVARIKLDRHFNGEQQINKAEVAKLINIMGSES